MSLSETVHTILEGTTGAVAPRAFAQGWEAAVPPADFPLAQISEILDTATCALCRAVDGKVIARSSPDYARWALPSHINCRRCMVFVSRDEVGPDGKPTQPDFEAPPQALIDKHGHFVSSPQKYEALRVPARPCGRDFIAYRPGGAEHVTLRWRDSLSDAGLRETLQTMARGLGSRLSTLSIPGDAELAAQMVTHASERELFANLKQLHARRAAEWADTAGPLSEDDLASVPRRMTLHPDTTLGTNVDDAGRVEWMLHNEKLPLDGKRNLDDVVTLYDPKRADLTDVLRVPGDEMLPAAPKPPAGRLPFEHPERVSARRAQIICGRRPRIAAPPPPTEYSGVFPCRTLADQQLGDDLEALVNDLLGSEQTAAKALFDGIHHEDKLLLEIKAKRSTSKYQQIRMGPDARKNKRRMVRQTGYKPHTILGIINDDIKLYWAKGFKSFYRHQMEHVATITKQGEVTWHTVLPWVTE
ncbi:MAG TPA: hypothetical protein VM285_07840 [Polyangia bacterium]|nr:hypothetical protein [Polyangia bacterium]